MHGSREKSLPPMTSLTCTNDSRGGAPSLILWTSRWRAKEAVLCPSIVTWPGVLEVGLDPFSRTPKAMFLLSLRNVAGTRGPSGGLTIKLLESCLHLLSLRGWTQDLSHCPLPSRKTFLPGAQHSACSGPCVRGPKRCFSPGHSSRLSFSFPDTTRPSLRPQ